MGIYPMATSQSEHDKFPCGRKTMNIILQASLGFISDNLLSALS